MDTLLVVVATFAAWLGFMGLALAMDRHFADWAGHGRQPGRWRPWLRVGGAAGLAVSLLACLAARSAAQGWVLWFGVMTVAALAVVLLLGAGGRRGRQF